MPGNDCIGLVVSTITCPGGRGMNDWPGVPVTAPQWIPQGSGGGNSGEGQWLTRILGRKRTDNLVGTETLWQEC